MLRLNSGSSLAARSRVVGIRSSTRTVLPWLRRGLCRDRRAPATADGGKTPTVAVFMCGLLECVLTSVVQWPEAEQNQRRCFNCEGRNHLSSDCPMRGRGAKYFECREFGHISSQCPKKQDEARKTHVVAQTLHKKYFKKVLITECEITALIDTGSDICVMRVDRYSKLGAPPLRENDVCFRGWVQARIERWANFQLK